jgi:hypothetical protein
LSSADELPSISELVLLRAWFRAQDSEDISAERINKYETALDRIISNASKHESHIQNSYVEGVRTLSYRWGALGVLASNEADGGTINTLLHSN